MPLFTRDQLVYAVNNRRKILELFEETNPGGGLLSFENSDRRGVLSMPRLYRQYVEDDPSELIFAEEVFNDYDHWLLVKTSVGLSDHIQKMLKHAALWRQAKDNQLKHAASAALMTTLNTEGVAHRDLIAAARAILSSQTIVPATPATDEPKKDGRAARKEERLRAHAADVAAGTDDDVSRLREAGLLPN